MRNPGTFLFIVSVTVTVITSFDNFHLLDLV